MDKPVKVVQVMEATTGGTRRHLADLVARLDKKRFQVSVICSTLRDPDFESDVLSMRERGIAVEIVRMVREINIAEDLAALARIRRHLRRHGYSIVHTHSSKAGFLGRLAARTERVPAVIHTPHVFPFQMDSGVVGQTLYLLLERFMARRTDKFICVCENGRKEALARHLAEPEKFVVIENGIEAGISPDAREAARGRLGLGPDDAVVGTVGRLTRQKGHIYLMRAMRDVVRRIPSAKLVIAGKGELKTEIERLAAASGLSACCRIVDPAALPIASFSALDLFALPSLWEGLPYSLLDALSAGTPVVASAVGGMPEALGGGSRGLLVPPKDTAALSDAICRVLSDKELAARFINAGSAALRERYGLDDMVRRTESLYDLALADRADRALESPAP